MRPSSSDRASTKASTRNPAAAAAGPGRLCRAAGRADPFGLLVLAVLLALSLTIGIQARLAASDERGGLSAMLDGPILVSLRRSP